MRRCKEEAAADATDGLACQALARMELGVDNSCEEAQASGWATPTLLYTSCFTLRSRTPPTELRVQSCASLICVTRGCEHPPRLDGVFLEQEMVGVEAAEEPQKQGREGKAGREKRASCRRPALKREGARRLIYMKAGNVAAESPGTFL